jgi:hypothetical protein
MLATRLPALHAVAFRIAVTRLPLRGQRRVWFLDWNTHRLPVSLAVIHDRYRKTAKHLTTSATMLTAAKAIGKSKREPIHSGLID